MRASPFRALRIVVCLWCASSGAPVFQLDLQGGYTFAPSSAGTTVYNGLDCAAYLAYQRSSAFYLVAGDHLRGAVTEPLRPEATLPTLNRAWLGLGTEAAGVVYAGWATDFFGYSRALSPPFMPNGATMTPRMLNTATVRWSGDFPWVWFDAGADYGMLSYTSASPAGSGPEEYDSDLWLKAGLGMNVPAPGLKLGAVTTLKRDFNAGCSYDLDDSRVFVAGTHALAARRLLLTWDLAERFLKSPAVHLLGRSDGFSTCATVRPVIKISTSAFLKGDVRVEAGAERIRQRYELAFRKAWKERASLDCVYWLTAGGAFPRQRLAVRATVAAGRFSVTPEAGATLRPAAGRSLPGEFYRADAALETRVRVTPRFSLLAGAGYQLFVDAPPYATGVALYGGGRLW